jgi:hypothetical protein
MERDEIEEEMTQRLWEARIGFSQKMFRKICSLIPNDNVEQRRKIYDALQMCKHNFTWDAAAAFSCRKDKVDERTMRRYFTEAAAAVRSGDILTPGIRFNDKDRRFPYVTAVVDGTPIPTRWNFRRHNTLLTKRKSATYSGKDHFKSWHVELWSTVSGIPIGFRGPIEGSQHDATLFYSEPPPFEHKARELFAMDIGYLGLPHALTPYKKNELEEYGGEDAVVRTNDGMVLPRRRVWNKSLGMLRSRIERVNSWMMKYRFFQYCDHDADWLKDAMTIVIAFEHYRYKCRPSAYQDPPIGWVKDDGMNDEIDWSAPRNLKCTCGMAPGNNDLVRRGKNARRMFSDRLQELQYMPFSKKPKNRKRSRSPAQPEDATGAVVLQDATGAVVTS